MSNEIGALVNVGIAVEATSGTAATPTYWLPATDKDFEDKAELTLDNSGYGVVGEDANASVTKQWADGSIQGNVYLTSLGVLLTGLSGSSPTTTTSSGEYTHVWYPTNTVSGKTLTIAMKDVNQDIACAYAAIDSMKFTLETGSFFNYETQFMSKKSASASNTTSYTADTLFAPQHATIKLASTQSGLAAASVIDVRSASITFAKNAEEKQNLGSKDLNGVYTKRIKVTGSLEIYHDGSTYKDFVFNETVRALRLGVVNTDVTLANSSNPHLFIDLYKVRFHDWERSKGNNDIVTETVEFTGFIDLSNSSRQYKIELLNAHAGTNY